MRKIPLISATTSLPRPLRSYFADSFQMTKDRVHVMSPHESAHVPNALSNVDVLEFAFTVPVLFVDIGAARLLQHADIGHVAYHAVPVIPG